MRERTVREVEQDLDEARERIVVLEARESGHLSGIRGHKRAEFRLRECVTELKEKRDADHATIREAIDDIEDRAVTLALRKLRGIAGKDPESG